MTHPVVKSHFEQSDYNARALEEATIPAECQERIACRIAWELRQTTPPNETIADLCCGGAWLPIRLTQYLDRPHNLYLCDNTPNQVRLARDNLRRFAPALLQRATFAVCDATTPALAQDTLPRQVMLTLL